MAVVSQKQARKLGDLQYTLFKCLIKSDFNWKIAFDHSDMVIFGPLNAKERYAYKRQSTLKYYIALFDKIGLRALDEAEAGRKAKDGVRHRELPSAIAAGARKQRKFDLALKKRKEKLKHLEHIKNDEAYVLLKHTQIIEHCTTISDLTAKMIDPRSAIASLDSMARIKGFNAPEKHNIDGIQEVKIIDLAGGKFKSPTITSKYTDKIEEVKNHPATPDYIKKKLENKD